MDATTHSSSTNAALLRISTQRAAIAVQRVALQEQDSQLAYLWNTYQHVMRIPAELLVDIFIKCAGLGYTYTSTWMKLRLVCRRWDEVIRGTPAFWRMIDVRTSLPWLRICLARSAQATLDITFHPGPSDRHVSLEGLRRTLFLHAARIRVISVFPRVSQQTLCNLLPLFDSDMPALEAVLLEPPLPADTELHLSHQRHPYVRTLHLQRVCRPVDFRLLSHLRSLTVSKCRGAFRVDDFLDSLASSSRLEELLLDNFLDGLMGVLVPPSTSSRKPIALPQLVVMRLTENNTSIISTFISHLRLPARTSIHLQCYAQMDEAGNISDMLSSFLPPMAHRVAFTPVLGGTTVTTVILSLFGTHYGLQAWDDSHGSSFSLNIYSVDEIIDDDSVGLQHGVEELLETFGAAPLKYLTISGIEDDAPAGVWDRLFTSFPALRTLTLSPVEPQNGMSSFWVAFGGSDGDSPDPETTSMLCPGLSRLELDGIPPISQELFLQILDCLERRWEGGSWLEYLRLGALIYEDDGHATNPPGDDLEILRLQALVDELAGRESADS